VDQENNHAELLQRGIKSWLSRKVETSRGFTRDKYRNGFWLNTTNRFFALQEFHRTIPHDSILHVEADVIISKQFPMSSFAEIRHPIAFPMSSPSVGLASTLWLRDSSSTDKLAEFAISKLSENPNYSDTDLLGLLAQTTPEEVLVLRSGPDDLSVYRNEITQNQQSLKGSDHRINNDGIFDASTIGIHLCGTDPRNSFGVSRIFDPLVHHFMKLDSIGFVIENNQVFLTTINERRTIYSFHNHSKNGKYFKNDFSQELSRYLPKRTFGEFKIISLVAFLKCLADYQQILMNKIKQTTFGNK